MRYFAPTDPTEICLKPLNNAIVKFLLKIVTFDYIIFNFLSVVRDKLLKRSEIQQNLPLHEPNLTSKTNVNNKANEISITLENNDCNVSEDGVIDAVENNNNPTMTVSIS